MTANTLFTSIICSDSRKIKLKKQIADVILTSPPYWKKRNYGNKNQIGLENTLEEYIGNLLLAVKSWKKALKPTGSLFINIGDTYSNGNLIDVSGLLISRLQKKKWILRNKIVWEKPNSTPHSAKNRLATRYEYILHFTLSREYYYDLEAFKEKYKSITNVWKISPAQHRGEHLAPFPEELVERILTLTCPLKICPNCNTIFRRVVENTAELDPDRPQARRAMEIAKESNLSQEHIAAIQAVGISDAGKAQRIQTGAGKNNLEIQKLALEAKKILGGYFREFTFAKKRTVGWTGCDCNFKTVPGLVLDPFVGSGTTLRVADSLGYSSIGIDMKFYPELKRLFTI